MPQIIGKERNGGAAAFPAPFFRCIGGACRGAAEICLEAIGIAAHGKAFPASDETLLSGRLKLLDPRADLACRIEPISRVERHEHGKRKAQPDNAPACSVLRRVHRFRHVSPVSLRWRWLWAILREISRWSIECLRQGRRQNAGFMGFWIWLADVAAGLRA